MAWFWWDCGQGTVGFQPMSVLFRLHQYYKCTEKSFSAVLLTYFKSFVRLIFKHRVITKAKLGRNVVFDMGKFKVKAVFISF